MANPITWRSISPTVGGGANQLFSAGQQQMQQGLAALQNLFADTTKEDKANREALRNYNTQQYLDRVAATDLTTLASKEGQAALAADRASFGVGIDQAATRTAVEQRLAAAQQAAVQQGKFDDFNTERDQRSDIDTLRGLAASGDKAAVDKMLADKQFLNEGDLRNELTKVFDDATQRTYRANAEGRAVRGEQRADAAEGRSAASHALSMEAGRENLNYAKAMHGESLRQLEETKAVDKVAAEAARLQSVAVEDQTTAIQNIAKLHNLDVKADGTIDLSDATESKKDAVAADLKNMSGSGAGATQGRQQLLDLARAQGLTVEATSKALQRYDTARSFDSLAPEDQEKLKTEVNTATREVADTEKRLTETFNRKSTNNPFMAPSNDVTADANKLTEAMAKKFDNEWFSTDINQDNVSRTAADLLQNGISFKLDGKDFTGVVPPSIIEQAMNSNGANKVMKEGGDIRKLVIDYIKDNKGIQKQMQEAQGLTEQYQKDMGKLAGERIKIESSIVRARKSEKGVTVSNNDWVDSLIKQRENRGK